MIILLFPQVLGIILLCNNSWGWRPLLLHKLSTSFFLDYQQPRFFFTTSALSTILTALSNDRKWWQFLPQKRGRSLGPDDLQVGCPHSLALLTILLVSPLISTCNPASPGMCFTQIDTICFCIHGIVFFAVLNVWNHFMRFVLKDFVLYIQWYF